jgi:hypothetical protein
MADPQSIRSFSDAALGAARFVDPVSTSPALMALLANVDAFNIWQLVIMAVGISVVGRVERSAGFVGAIVAWGLGVALTVVPALLA